MVLPWVFSKRRWNGICSYPAFIASALLKRNSVSFDPLTKIAWLILDSVALKHGGQADRKDPDDGVLELVPIPQADRVQKPDHEAHNQAKSLPPAPSALRLIRTSSLSADRARPLASDAKLEHLHYLDVFDLLTCCS